MKQYKCPQCGNMVPADAEKCPVCGHVTTPDDVRNAEMITHLGAHRGGAKPWRVGWLMLGGIAALCLLLFFFLSDRNGDQTASLETREAVAIAVDGAKTDLESLTEKSAEKFQAALDYLKAEPARAKAYFEQAAAEGNLDAKAALGEMYAFGVGVAQDAGKGVTMLREAAEQGSSYAMAKLGEMYVHGSAGLERNFDKGVGLMKQAIATGGYYGQVAMAKLYETGAGVEKDADKAVSYYKEAAARGYVNAERAIDAIVERPNYTMAPEALAHVYYVEPEASAGKYDDHKIRLTGTVENVHTLSSGAAILTFVTKDVHLDVDCIMDAASTTAAATLKEGTTVTVQGIGGGRQGNTVVLEECWFPTASGTFVQK